MPELLTLANTLGKSRRVRPESARWDILLLQARHRFHIKLERGTLSFMRSISASKALVWFFRRKAGYKSTSFPTYKLGWSGSLSFLREELAFVSSFFSDASGRKPDAVASRDSMGA